MIFSVKAMPSMPAGYSHVAKSTQFGFFGVPMVFQVTSGGMLTMNLRRLVAAMVAD